MDEEFALYLNVHHKNLVDKADGSVITTSSSSKRSSTTTPRNKRLILHPDLPIVRPVEGFMPKRSLVDEEGPKSSSVKQGKITDHFEGGKEGDTVSPVRSPTKTVRREEVSPSKVPDIRKAVPVVEEEFSEDPTSESAHLNKSLEKCKRQSLTGYFSPIAKPANSMPRGKGLAKKGEKENKQSSSTFDEFQRRSQAMKSGFANAPLHSQKVVGGGAASLPPSTTSSSYRNPVSEAEDEGERAVAGGDGVEDYVEEDPNANNVDNQREVVQVDGDPIEYEDVMPQLSDDNNESEEDEEMAGMGEEDGEEEPTTDATNNVPYGYEEVVAPDLPRMVALRDEGDVNDTVDASIAQMGDKDGPSSAGGGFLGDEEGVVVVEEYEFIEDEEDLDRTDPMNAAIVPESGASVSSSANSNRNKSTQNEVVHLITQRDEKVTPVTTMKNVSPSRTRMMEDRAQQGNVTPPGRRHVTSPSQRDTESGQKKKPKQYKPFTGDDEQWKRGPARDRHQNTQRMAEIMNDIATTQYPPYRNPSTCGKRNRTFFEVRDCPDGSKNVVPKPEKIEDPTLRKTDNNYVRLPHSSGAIRFPDVRDHMEYVCAMIDSDESCSTKMKLIRDMFRVAHDKPSMQIRGLERYLEYRIDSQIFEDLKIREQESFFASMKYVAHLVADAHNILTAPIPLLNKEVHSVTLSLEQCSALLALAFLGLFPGRRNNNSRNFKWLPQFDFTYLIQQDDDLSVQKLCFMMNYFSNCYHVANRREGVVTFVRRSIEESEMPDWKKSDAKFTRLGVSGEGRIEDVANTLHVDFANKYIGGGVLHQGAVQEEIRFLCCPDMLVSLLLCPVMEPNEAVVIIGAPTYSDYTGYSDSLKWKPYTGIWPEMDEFYRYNTEIVAIDAIPFYSDRQDQYKEVNVLRELNKAYVGFTNPDHLSMGKVVSTGNWGCGAFGGDPYLKSLIQYMAASVCRRDMLYFTFRDETLKNKFDLFSMMFKKYNLTVGDVYKILVSYGETPRKDRSVNITGHILQRFHFLRNVAEADANAHESG